MSTKEEIAQNEQFLLLSSCFQLFSISVLWFKGSFQICSDMFSKSSAADLLYVGKGLRRFLDNTQQDDRLSELFQYTDINNYQNL